MPFAILSANHPIRPHQHVGRDRQADLLGRFQIDDELEFLWLLDRQVGWLACLSESYRRRSLRAGISRNARAIGHEPPVFDKSEFVVDRWQPALCRQVDDPFPL